MPLEVQRRIFLRIYIRATCLEVRECVDHEPLRIVVRNIQPPFVLGSDGRYLAFHSPGKLAFADIDTGEHFELGMPAGLTLSTVGAWSAAGRYYAALAYPISISARELQTRAAKLLVVDVTNRRVQVHVPPSGRLDTEIPVQWLTSDTVLVGTEDGLPWSVRVGGVK